MAFRSSTVVLQLGIVVLGVLGTHEMRKKSPIPSISLRPLAVVVAFLTLAPSFVPAANKAEPSLRGPAVPWPMGIARRNQASFPSSRCLGEEKTKPAASVFVKQSPWPRQPPQQASFGILVWVRDAGADLR